MINGALTVWRYASTVGPIRRDTQSDETPGARVPSQAGGLAFVALSKTRGDPR
jgi:hypothetical protein